jgi:hypothetical protein
MVVGYAGILVTVIRWHLRAKSAATRDVDAPNASTGRTGRGQPVACG